MQPAARAESDSCSETRPTTGQNVIAVSAGIAATVCRIFATRDAIHGRVAS